MNQPPNRLPSIALALTLSWVTGGLSEAQMPAVGISPAMKQLLGGHDAFTAKVQMIHLDESQREVMTLTMIVAMADGKTRVEMDATQMVPNAAAEMRKRRVDQTIVIVRPDQRLTYYVFPRRKVYLEMPMSEEAAAALTANDQEPEIKMTEVGRETIDGHPCVKNQVRITPVNGPPSEALLWCAMDLNRFPVRMQSAEPGGTSVVKYSRVKLGKPKAARFEPPPGAKRVENMDDLSKNP